MADKLKQIRLRPGKSGMSNKVFSIRPGQTISIPAGFFVDPESFEVVETIETDIGPHIDIYESKEVEEEEEKTEEKISVDIEVEEVKEEKEKERLTSSGLTKISGIGRVTAKKILTIIKYSDEILDNKQTLIDELRDDVVEKLINKYC